MNEPWNVIKKDENGNKFDIRIIMKNKQLVIDEVGYIPKGKRKPQFVSHANSVRWRGLGSEEKIEAKKQEILNVTPEHLLVEALADVWAELKPKELTFS